MALILNIDTSMDTASVSIGKDGDEIGKLVNPNQKDHASWIHEASSNLLTDRSIEPGQLNAVAVTAGPGSYTGIRVGMASAKGLAYALSIPMIVENTLNVMAWSQIQAMRAANSGEEAATAGMLFCPMIDARRDEVFTAVFDHSLSEITPPLALRLTSNSFETELLDKQVNFFGNGSDKWKQLNHHKNGNFMSWDYAYFNLAYLSYQSFLKGNFADLAYVLPNYLKEVYTYKKN